MFTHLRPLLANIGALALIFLAFTYLAMRPSPVADSVVSLVQTEATTSTQVASANTPSQPSVVKIVATTTTPAILPEVPAAQTPPGKTYRIQNPYPFPAESTGDLNTETRAALVNILCTSKNGSLSPISGSGVMIDPRGVILTNAHVAQYVLLSQSPRIDLSCSIRAGSPASAHWRATILYIPPVWVNSHANEITTPRPIGTGEHDYALLLITDTTDGSPLPASFPALPYDTREAIGFVDDQALVASYPAEFLGGIAAQMSLFPASSFTTIGKLQTFSDGSVDVISVGGVIEAQSGSSGGAVVNAWGRLIALIATTSDAKTTAERDLHALTLSYINRDLLAQSQSDLSAMLGGDLAAKAQDFGARVAPDLIQLYIDQLTAHR